MKAEGWSVVLGLNEIIARPKDRTGKFSIIFVRGVGCSVACFSRELNFWNKRKYFNSDVSLAASINDWMLSAAADPLSARVTMSNEPQRTNDSHIPTHGPAQVFDRSATRGAS